MMLPLRFGQYAEICQPRRLEAGKGHGGIPLDLHGCICGDIGASTGGFTGCMLQNGASKVYAVDVGYGQLAWKLREDPRVVCMERTNARYLSHEQISVSWFCSPLMVSFISLKLILPAVAGYPEGTAAVWPAL